MSNSSVNTSSVSGGWSALEVWQVSGWCRALTWPDDGDGLGGDGAHDD